MSKPEPKETVDTKVIGDGHVSIVVSGKEMKKIVRGVAKEFGTLYSGKAGFILEVEGYDVNEVSDYLGEPDNYSEDQTEDE